MAKRLQQEIQQRTPFARIEQEAVLNVMRTADRIGRFLQQIMKPHGITPTQYNALRILRGAGESGITCSELGRRLVSHDPDITRLIERMARQKLVRRRRDQKDRRVVLTYITPEGLELLKRMDPVMDRALVAALQQMSPESIEQLSGLLEETRASLEESELGSAGLAASGSASKLTEA